MGITKRFCFNGLFLSLSALVVQTGFAADKTWDFSLVRYAACEGVGASASYHIHVQANYAPSGGGYVIQTLAATVSSAAFGVNPGDVSGTLDAKTSQGNAVVHVDLAKAWFATISSSGDTDQSLYLPPASSPPGKTTPQKPIQVPSGSILHLSVNPIVSVGGNACPLGGSDNVLAF